MRSAGAVKYNLGDTIPNNLQRVAIVELADGDSVPPNIVEYDVEYYNTPDLIPPAKLPLAAHAYTLGQTIPNFLKQICAFVVSLTPWTFTDGKSLKFNTVDNSMHLATAL